MRILTPSPKYTLSAIPSMKNAAKMASFIVLDLRSFFPPSSPPSKHEKCGQFGCISRVCVSIQSLPHSLHEQRSRNGHVFVLDLTFTLTLAQTRKNTASLAAFSCLGTYLIPIPF